MQSAEHSVQRGPRDELLSLLFSEFEAILVLCHLAAQPRHFICETSNFGRKHFVTYSTF